MSELAQFFLSKQKEIVTSKKAEQITTVSQNINGVIVKAPATNAETVYVGNSEITNIGFGLEAGESLQIDCIDPTRIYVYGTEKDKVHIFAVIP